MICRVGSRKGESPVKQKKRTAVVFLHTFEVHEPGSGKSARIPWLKLNLNKVTKGKDKPKGAMGEKKQVIFQT